MEPTEKHLAVLKKYFGHKEFRPMQWSIIRSVIEDKRDNCVVMATGYGKSLCFQYPPVYCSGVGIVVSPLISLMQDQVLSLKMKNIPACFLGSAQSEVGLVVNDLLAGKYRLVYVTPEWCTNEYGIGIFEKLLQNYINITLVAIDEAHCVSQWGFDFRKSYRNLGKLRKLFPEVPFLTLTATATPQVRQDIISNLHLRNPQKICTSFDRPNLFLSVSIKGPDLLSDLRNIINQQNLRNNGTGSTIIYCPTKKMADKIYSTFKVAGLNCNMYHAGLSQTIRNKVHDEFVQDTVPIIIATVAFGMGIDKPDVRTILHYGAPKDIESYYQEIGRAGRDGLPSICHAFYSQADFALCKSFVTPYQGNFKIHKEEMQRKMECYLQTSDCRRRFILRHFSPGSNYDDIDPELCCDNCVKRGKGSKLEIDHDLSEDTIMLLKAVEFMAGKYGLSTYILFLRGSNNKRLPVKFHNHELYGAGRNKNELWWKLLGGLLLRESLLEENISNFGQGWNKNNFPIKVVGITEKGRHYIAMKGKSVYLEPTPEMLPMISRIPKKTEDGWLDMTREANETICVPNEESVSLVRNASLEDKIFNELQVFRSKMAKELNCIPYMVLDNKSMFDLSVKRPTTLEELSAVEGINDAKITNFGKECLEFIQKIIEKHDSGMTTTTTKSVCAKRFMKNFMLKPPPKVFRFETEEINDTSNVEVATADYGGESSSQGTDEISSQNIVEDVFSDDEFNSSLMLAMDEIELNSASLSHGKEKSLVENKQVNKNDTNNELKSLENILNSSTDAPSSSVTNSSSSETSIKRKRYDETVRRFPTLQDMIKINEEKKKASKKKIRL